MTDSRHGHDRPAEAAGCFAMDEIGIPPPTKRSPTSQPRAGQRREVTFDARLFRAAGHHASCAMDGPSALRALANGTTSFEAMER